VGKSVNLGQKGNGKEGYRKPRLLELISSLIKKPSSPMCIWDLGQGLGHTFNQDVEKKKENQAGLGERIQGKTRSVTGTRKVGSANQPGSTYENGEWKKKMKSDGERRARAVNLTSGENHAGHRRKEGKERAQQVGAMKSLCKVRQGVG